MVWFESRTTAWKRGDRAKDFSPLRSLGRTVGSSPGIAWDYKRGEAQWGISSATAATG